MKYKFNQTTAMLTFVIVIIVWVIGGGINRFQNNRDMPVIGSLLYGIAGLFAAIFSGLIFKEKKKLIDCKPFVREALKDHAPFVNNITEEREKEKELKRLHKNRLISQKTKEYWKRRKAKEFNQHNY